MLGHALKGFIFDRIAGLSFFRSPHDPQEINHSASLRGDMPLSQLFSLLNWARPDFQGSLHCTFHIPHPAFRICFNVLFMPHSALRISIIRPGPAETMTLHRPVSKGGFLSDNRRRRPSRWISELPPNGG